MSSRNSYLSPQQRRQAAALYASLRLGQEMIRSSGPPGRQVINAVREYLARHAPDGVIDYIQIVDPGDLKDVEKTDAPVCVALAVRFGRTRLIDNILVDVTTAKP